MILMLAPGPGITFSAMPSGSIYVADPYALIHITNNSTADQMALAAAGCFTLSPFGDWGNRGFDTLANLYAYDNANSLPHYTVATVFSDGTNNGTWAKTGSGNGSGQWTQVSLMTLAQLQAEIVALQSGISALTTPWQFAVLGAAKYATAAALAANTYNNGSSGVGATLTANSNGALSVDGASPVANDRVLVKNENNPINNGLYVVTQTGDGSHPYILMRATDADTAGKLAAFAVYVSAGSTQGTKAYILPLSGSSIVIGTTALIFYSAPFAVLASGIFEKTYSSGDGSSLQEANISSSVNVVAVGGGLSRGDGGACFRVRGVTGPWAIQSADGAYWVIADAAPPNWRQTGAKGDNIQNDTTAASNAGIGSYAPPGTYNLTAIPAEAWGPGLPTISGIRIPLPLKRNSMGRQQAILSKMASISAAGGYVTVIGDSIGYAYFASSGRKAWWGLLQQAMQQPGGSAGSWGLVSMMNLDNGSYYGFYPADASFNPIPTGSLTHVVAGPLNDCPQLANTQFWYFPQEKIDQFDCYYQTGTAFTTGSILLQVNTGSGWTTLKTITPTASPSLECYTGTNPSNDADQPTATGAGNVLADYRILASGGTITITGAVRNVTGVTGAFVPNFAQMAYPGTGTPHWAGVLGSCFNQMQRAKTNSPFIQGMVIVELGTNDIYQPSSSAQSTTPAQYEANLITIFRQIQTAGHYPLAIGVYRCSPDTPGQTGYYFENYEDAAERAAEICGVQIIRLNAFPWVASGLLSDGTHPGDVGHDKYFCIVSDFLADEWKPVRNKYQPFSPVLAFGGNQAGFTYSTSEGQYSYENGKVTFRARIITSVLPSRTDPQAVTMEGLPIPPQGNLQVDIAAITSTGVTVTTGPLGGAITGPTASVGLGVRTNNGKLTVLQSSAFPAAGAGVADLYIFGSYFDGTSNKANG